MKTVFSGNSPVLKLNSFQTQSDKDEQQGYMDIFAGSDDRNSKSASYMSTVWSMIRMWHWNYWC